MKKITLLLICIVWFSSVLYAIACLGDNPEEIYFVAFAQDNEGLYTRYALYKTEDYGKTAHIINVPFNRFIYKDAAEGCFYKVTLGESLYFSSDYCQTWIWKNSDMSSKLRSGIFPGECWKDGRTVSFNCGENFQENEGNGITTQIKTWFLDDEAGAAYAYCINNILYKTVDYGDNYEIINNLEDYNFVGVGRGWEPGELFGYAYDGKAYRSTNSGQSFEFSFNNPIFSNEYTVEGSSLMGYESGELIRYTVNQYFTLDSLWVNFYRSTDMGASWDTTYTKLNGVSIQDNDVSSKYNMRFSPNPFNPVTNISYTLPENMDIEINLYNIKGERVREIDRGYKNKGQNNILLDGRNLSSGVYFVSLKSKKYKTIKKCLLVK